VGPNSHVVDVQVDAEVFAANGAVVVQGAHIGQETGVHINGAVHLRTGLTVPIGMGGRRRARADPVAGSARSYPSNPQAPWLQAA